MNEAKSGVCLSVVTPHVALLMRPTVRAMLRGKTVEMPGRKHDNLPVRGNTWQASISKA